MGVSQNHAIGRNRKFFVETEPTAGTFVKATSAGAAKVLDSNMDLQIESKVREDSRATRSAMEHIEGKGTVAWTCEQYLLPSGAAGTPTDSHELFYAALGTYANVPSTSDTYSPSDSQTLRTVSLTHQFNDAVMESVWGAWVNAMTLSASGGDDPKVSFEGGAMGMAQTGTSTLNGAMSASTTMTVQTADGYNFEDNSVVQIGSTGDVEVTVDTSRPAFTVDTSTTEDDASTVIPYVPAETTAGSPTNGITGSLSLDATEYPVTAFDVTVSNNVKPLDDEAFQQFPDDIIPGWRQVTGTITIRARKDHIIELGKRKAFALRDIAVVLGSGAGTTVTVNLNQVRFGFAAATFPSADEGSISLPFIAYGSSGADEIDIVFT